VTNTFGISQRFHLGFWNFDEDALDKLIGRVAYRHVIFSRTIRASLLKPNRTASDDSNADMCRAWRPVLSG